MFTRFSKNIQYVLTNYLSLFFSVIRGLLLIEILSPIHLGVYRLFFTYSSYFRYYNFGLNALAFYRAPLKAMRHTYSQVLLKTNFFLSWTLGAGFTAVFVFLLGENLTYVHILSIAGLFVILVFTQMNETYVTICKIYNTFGRINKYNLILSVSGVLLVIPLGYFLELDGVIAALTLSTLLAFLFLRRVVRSDEAKLRLRLTFRRIMVMGKAGVKTILPGMVLVLFTTVEVWILTDKYGVEETGYYSVVLTIINILMILNTDSLVFLYAGNAKTIAKDSGYTLRITFLFFALLSIVSVASLFIIDWMVHHVFQQYTRSAKIYRLCFWGIPFLVFRNIVMYYIARNRAVQVLWFLSLLLAMKVVALMLANSTTAFYSQVALMNLIFGVGMIVFLIVNEGFHATLNNLYKKSI